MSIRCGGVKQSHRDGPEGLFTYREESVSQLCDNNSHPTPSLKSLPPSAISLLFLWVCLYGTLSPVEFTHLLFSGVSLIFLSLMSS